MKTNLILSFILVFSFSVNAQKWTTFNTANSGLLNNSITSIAIDKDSSIWIATIKGLCHYDVKHDTAHFKSVKIPSFKKDSLPPAFTPWTYFKVNNYISAIAIDAHGNKWIGTYESSIYKFDGVTWTTYSSGFTNDIAVDRQNNIWFATNYGVRKFDGVNWTTYNTSDGLAGSHVYSVGIDTLGNKLFGTSAGISKFDGSTWVTDSAGFGHAKKNVDVIKVDKRNHIYYGTDTDGVLEFYDGTHYILHNTFDGLSNFDVNDIAIDNQGNLWVATGGLFGGGFSKIAGSTITNYHHTLDCVDCLADEYVTSVAIDFEGNKWIGTQHGLSKLKAEISNSREIKNKSLLIYPNPADNVLFLKNSPVSNVTLTIFDLQGKEVLLKKLDSNTVDISTLPKGVYIIQVVNMEDVLTNKFVKN